MEKKLQATLADNTLKKQEGNYKEQQKPKVTKIKMAGTPNL